MPGKLLLLQTSDPFRYYDMLQATARTVRRYCEIWDHDYQQFVGVKRGFWPWQATFNRVYLFSELLESGRSGWCLYMDADAYVRDFDFDIKSYLEDHQDSLLICTRSGASHYPYDVNVGVMALNLGHELARELVSKWRESFEQIPEAELQAAEREWPAGMPDDQVMLQWLLRDNEHLQASLRHASPLLMNAPRATFIRQYLRALNADLATRTDQLRQITDRVIEQATSIDVKPVADFGPTSQHFEIVEGLYKVILRRSADEYGRQAFAEMLSGEGLTQGVPHVVDLLLSGDEFKHIQAVSAGHGG